MNEMDQDYVKIASKDKISLRDVGSTRELNAVDALFSNLQSEQMYFSFDS